jgi:hypothetical protein
VHDLEFRQAERDWHSFVTALTEKLIEIDDSIPELPVKDLVSPTHIRCTMHENLAHHKLAAARSSESIGMYGSVLTRHPTVSPRAGMQPPPTFMRVLIRIRVRAAFLCCMVRPPRKEVPKVRR